jgi:hypothetical protein
MPAGRESVRSADVKSAPAFELIAATTNRCKGTLCRPDR